MINFAQGEMDVFAAFVALWLIDWGWPYWAASCDAAWGSRSSAASPSSAW